MLSDIRCLAWQAMRRQRHCPSIKILQLGGSFVERHLTYCEHCRTALEQAAELSELGKILLQLPLQQPPATTPVPGDVRALRPHMAPEEWVDADGTFYNPPLLLVLSSADAYGLVRTAQVFSEPALQDEGDISLGLGLIAEAWNIYAVPEEALDSVPYTHVESSTVQAVLEAAKGPFSALDERSPLFHFRCDECDLGGFFSLALNAAILHKLEVNTEQPKARIIPFGKFSSPACSGSSASSHSDRQIQTQLATLLEMKQDIHDNALPLAAASAPALGSPTHRIPATLYRFSQADSEVCSATIEHIPTPDTTMYRIICHIDSPATDGSAAVCCGDAYPQEIACTWHTNGNLIITAVFAEKSLPVDAVRVAILLSCEEE